MMMIIIMLMMRVMMNDDDDIQSETNTNFSDNVQCSNLNRQQVASIHYSHTSLRTFSISARLLAIWSNPSPPSPSTTRHTTTPINK